MCSRRHTSAGVDVLCSRGLTDQVVLVEPRAFFCDDHWLGCSFSPGVDHLRDGICIWKNKIIDSIKCNLVFLFTLKMSIMKLVYFLTFLKKKKLSLRTITAWQYLGLKIVQLLICSLIGFSYLFSWFITFGPYLSEMFNK